MTPWQEFYGAIRDLDWPDCDTEQGFHNLPDWIKKECSEIHGYQPGEYQSQSTLAHRSFPIQTQTACQLKWTWSTVFLTTGTTASCHRTNHHEFDKGVFDFHNTPEKIHDRSRMLQGLWPTKGCDYCKNIESAGGQSDRLTNLDMPGIHAPPEIDTDATAIKVTPRILEVYFDNICNLKCLYCGPHFSSLWDAENKKNGTFRDRGLVISDKFVKDLNIEKNKQKLFHWLESNCHHLTNFNILGGEPLFQKDFDQCLDFFDRFPAPHLDLQIFTNLNASEDKINSTIHAVKKLVDQKKIKKFTVTASLDCWGPAQEYVRFPLDLAVWKRNFETLLNHHWITLIVGSTITPLTIRTLPDLVHQINEYRKIRPVHHYFNSVNGPSYMFIDIFGDLFVEDFEKTLCMMPQDDPDQSNTYRYLQGIAQQSAANPVNLPEVQKLKTFLDEMDRRRSTDWREVFPWLDPVFKQILSLDHQS
jgi:hypothetical protein